MKKDAWVDVDSAVIAELECLEMVLQFIGVL
jgi:hypothetical protein